MPSSDGLTVHLSKIGFYAPILLSLRDPAKERARMLHHPIATSGPGQQAAHRIRNNVRVHTPAVPATRQRDKAHSPRNLQRLCSLTAVPGHCFTRLTILSQPLHIAAKFCPPLRRICSRKGIAFGLAESST